MALFKRSGTPPQYQSHRSYKRYLRVDFQFRCAYCEATEGYLRGPDAFGADHFRPYQKFPWLDCVYANLYYCCNRCNSYKGTNWPNDELRARGRFFTDPCVEDPYESHIGIEASGEAIPLSPAGDYTVRTIRLDREECRRFRVKRETVGARIRQYREALGHGAENSPIGELLRQALADAEAEFIELFAPEAQSTSGSR